MSQYCYISVGDLLKMDYEPNTSCPNALSSAAHFDPCTKPPTAGRPLNDWVRLW